VYLCGEIIKGTKRVKKVAKRVQKGVNFLNQKANYQ